MSRQLWKKRALVTEGSRGIGAAITKRLARDGANVAFTYGNQAEQADKTAGEAREHGVKTLAIKADSANPDAIIEAVELTEKAFGGIDILVNNAGIAVMAPLSEYKLKDFDRMFDVNVRAVFVATQAATEYMKEGGRIIMIGSCNAERMPYPGGAVYAMTKAALVGLVKGLAHDLGPRRITVNNIQPGPVETDMNPSSGAFAEKLKSLMALPRYASGDEIASLVAYLASAEAAFVTGASLTIDGGFTA